MQNTISPFRAGQSKTKTSSETLDFRRSFIVFEIDQDKVPAKTVSDTRQNRHNRARIEIICSCEVTDPQGKTTQYFLGEACKSERVGVTPDVGIFTQPNADFRPASSKDHLIAFKSWDKNDKGVMLQPPSLGPQPERQIVDVRKVYSHHALQLRHTPARLLADAQAIIQATDDGEMLVARTEYSMNDHLIVLDYPIFTINVSEKLVCYQTDTGPVLFPEVNLPHTQLEDTLRLAFCAFNSPDWIEFIVQKPTPIGHGLSVNHYSETVQIRDCRNSIYAV